MEGLYKDWKRNCLYYHWSFRKWKCRYRCAKAWYRQSKMDHTSDTDTLNAISKQVYFGEKDYADWNTASDLKRNDRRWFWRTSQISWKNGLANEENRIRHFLISAFLFFGYSFLRRRTFGWSPIRSGRRFFCRVVFRRRVRAAAVKRFQKPCQRIAC